MDNSHKPKVMDDYVQDIIKHYSKELGMNVDPVCPTREQRLQIALALDRNGDESSRWTAIEIMVGRRIKPSESNYNFLLMQYTMFPQDAKAFYDGFTE